VSDRVQELLDKARERESFADTLARCQPSPYEDAGRRMDMIRTIRMEAVGYRCEALVEQMRATPPQPHDRRQRCGMCHGTGVRDGHGCVTCGGHGRVEW